MGHFGFDSRTDFFAAVPWNLINLHGCTQKFEKRGNILAISLFCDTMII